MKPEFKKSQQINNKKNNNETDVNSTSDKRPFDKKKYRLKKYSNKYKVDKYEEQRKKSVLRRFYGDLHKSQKNESLQSSTSTPDNEKSSDSSKTNEKKNYQPNAYIAAKMAFKKKQEEKNNRIQAIIKAKAEKEEALKKYKEKKLRKNKILSKNTRKGQPVMKDRIKLLLEQIQEKCN